MNPQSILAQLEPLRSPDAIGWWPPAPGWWLVALVALVLVWIAARAAWRFYRRGAPLRAAQGALSALRSSEAELSDRITALSRLHRRLAIRIAGRRSCAGLTGPAWADFLNALAASDETFFDTHLAELSYRPGVTQDDWNDALDATSRWLARLERPA